MCGSMELFPALRCPLGSGFGVKGNSQKASFKNGRVAVERGARGAGDFDGEDLADVAGGPFEDDDLVRARLRASFSIAK
jgi:hypothetical protein